MATKNLIPRGSGEGGLGISDTVWGHGYFDTGHFNKGLYISGLPIDQALDQAGVGGKWEDSATAGNIYYNGGNVGVGTQTANEPLRISSAGNAGDNVRLAGFEVPSIAGNLLVARIMGQSANNSSECQLSFDLVDRDGLDHSPILTIKNNSANSSVIINSDHVGIGTATPGSYLHVAGHHNGAVPFILDRGTFSNQTNGVYDPVTGGFLWQQFRHNDITDWTLGGQTDTADGTTLSNLTISNPTQTVMVFEQPEVDVSGVILTSGAISIQKNNYLQINSPINKKIVFRSYNSATESQVGSILSLEMDGSSLAVYNQSNQRYLTSFHSNGDFSLDNIPCNNNVDPASTMISAAFSLRTASSTVGTGKSKDLSFTWGPNVASPADYTIDNTDLLFTTINESGSPREVSRFYHTGQVRIGIKSEEMIISPGTPPNCNTGYEPNQDNTACVLIGAQTYRSYGDLTGGSLEIRDERNKNASNAHLRIVGGSSAATTGSHYIDNNIVPKYIISQDIVGGEIHMISSSAGVKLATAATSWVSASSDRRSKENISPLENVLDKVLKLSPSRYDYKEEYGNKDQIGFIAQDVEEVLPDFYLPGATEEEMSTVKFSDNATTALLVKAIQEQNALIEDLKSRIETLENK